MAFLMSAQRIRPRVKWCCETEEEMKIIFWSALFFVELGMLIVAVRDLADAIRDCRKPGGYEPEQVEYTEEECGRHK